MKTEIDRNSVVQLRKELEEWAAIPFATHKIMTSVDVALILQVIQEWELKTES